MTDQALKVLPQMPGARHILDQILKAMRETHESMRAVLAAAAEQEKRSKHKTGAHFDAVLLARPQLDSLFAGLLVLHDPTKYGALYQRAGWVDGFQRACYENLRSGTTPRGRVSWQRHSAMYLALAPPLGLSPLDIKVARAHITHEPLSATEKKHTLEFFPLPRVAAERLTGSEYEGLAETSYREWKFQSGVSHMGIRVLTRKALLRGEASNWGTPIPRSRILNDEVVLPSIIVSLVASLALATAVVVKWASDQPSLFVQFIEAWDPLVKGTSFGSLVWDAWAKKHLRVI